MNYPNPKEEMTFQRWIPNPNGPMQSAFPLLYSLQVIERLCTDELKRHDNISKGDSLNKLKFTSSNTETKEFVINQEGKEKINSNSIKRCEEKNKEVFIVIDEEGDKNLKANHSKVQVSEQNHDDTDLNDWKSKNKWCQCFLSLGGLRYFISLLKSIDFKYFKSE